MMSDLSCSTKVVAFICPGVAVYFRLIEPKTTPPPAWKKTIGVSLSAIPVIGILAGAIALVYYRRSWVTPIRNLSCPWKKAGAIAGVSLAGIVGTCIAGMNLLLCLCIPFHDPSSQQSQGLAQDHPQRRHGVGNHHPNKQPRAASYQHPTYHYQIPQHNPHSGPRIGFNSSPSQFPLCPPPPQ